MKLSTRGRYGLRMLTDLGRQNDVTTLKSVAKRQEVSVHYLEQVAKDLKRAGYIKSVKGPQGGYYLAKTPKDITVGNVLRLLEGDILLTEVSANDNTLISQCVNQTVFEPLNQRVAELFDSISLHDILNGKKL